MADWFSGITADEEKPAAASGDWFSSVAQETQSVPPAVQPDAPIVKDPSKGVGLKQRFIAGFASDDAEKMRYYAQQLYPNEPVDQAVQRFGMRGNRMFHKADDGQLYEVVPSSTLGTIAEGAGSALPVGGGAVGAITTAPLATTGVGAVGTIAASAGAAGLGEVARQKLGDYMMGDASTENINWWNVTNEAVTSGAGQVIGAGAGNMAQRSQVRDIARLNQQTTQRAYDEADRRGLKLTPGQATGLRTLQAEEKRLNTRVPETMDEMGDFLRQQSKDIEDAWYTELDKIAPQRDAEATGRAIRTAAEKTLKDYQTARMNAARPIYQQWEKEAAPVDTKAIISNIDAELARAARGGATERALLKAKSFLTDDKGAAIADPVKLHNARVELSNIIDTKSVDGTALNNVISGRLNQVKTELTTAMDKASPLYAQARGTFSTLSDDVDDAFGSALSRIAKLDDTNLLAVVRETFNPATRSPEMIEKLRVRLSAKDPTAWKDLKRLWLQDAVSDNLRTAQSGEVLNPAGKIVSALEDPATRRSLNAALDPAEKQSLADMTWLFRRISNANLRMNSDTAANLGADKAALDRATPLWAKAARAVGRILQPSKWGEMAAERKLLRNAQELVKLVTSGDREALSAIRELRNLSDREWRALAASGQLGTQGLVAATSVVNSTTKDEE